MAKISRPSAFKEKIKPWSPLTPTERTALTSGFVHLSGKTIHSHVNGVGVRWAFNQPQPDLPYVALSTLGASWADLDYSEGGAAGEMMGRARQVRDHMSGVSSGVVWDTTTMPNCDAVDLSVGGALHAALAQPLVAAPAAVPVRLKQVLVPANGRPDDDVSISPLGSMGLTKIIRTRLAVERDRRAVATGDKNLRPFWRQAGNSMGGTKPNNLGLVAGVAEGPATAGFAWLFRPPVFPDASRVGRAVLRGPRVTAALNQVMGITRVTIEAIDRESRRNGRSCPDLVRRWAKAAAAAMRHAEREWHRRLVRFAAAADEGPTRVEDLLAGLVADHRRSHPMGAAWCAGVRRPADRVRVASWVVERLTAHLRTASGTPMILGRDTTRLLVKALAAALA